MLETYLSSPSGFTWIDATDPTDVEMDELAERFKLTPSMVRNCLDPYHLPKVEIADDFAFYLVRYSDPNATEEARSIVSLTRKMAFFVGDKFLVTVHRSPCAFLESVRLRWQKQTKESTPLRWALDVFRGVLLSFEALLKKAEDELENQEERIFSGSAGAEEIRAMHRIRSRLAVCRKMLRQNLDVIYAIDELPKALAPLGQDLREDGNRIFYFSERLVEELDHVTQVHLSLESHRTGEVMRILTLFSVFFLPLTFIVGVYGMNFKHMPEIEHPLGYAYVWGLLAATAGGIYLWFRRQGWMR